MAAGLASFKIRNFIAVTEFVREFLNFESAAAISAHVSAAMVGCGSSTRITQAVFAAPGDYWIVIPELRLKGFRAEVAIECGVELDETGVFAKRRMAAFAPRPLPMSCHRCGVRTAYSRVARMFFPRRTFRPDGLSAVMG